MNIQYALDNRKRVCGCCSKPILKGDLYVDETIIIDGWNNTRKFFSHIQCLILKLINLKEKAKKELININYVINRYVE